MVSTETFTNPADDSYFQQKIHADHEIKKKVGRIMIIIIFLIIIHCIYAFFILWLIEIIIV